MPKITRDAFLYMIPRGKPDDFAQCSKCMMWNGSDGEAKDRCHIHGPNIVITGDMTCGLYVYGDPHKAKLMAAVTPQESGLEKRKVRCENCMYSRHWGGKYRCAYFTKLNDDLPQDHDLLTEIEPKACCNANRAKE
jgi:hypothetical protein